MKTKRCEELMTHLRKKLNDVTKNQLILRYYEPAKRKKRLIGSIIGFALCIVITSTISAIVTHFYVSDIANNVQETQNEIIRL